MDTPTPPAQPIVNPTWMTIVGWILTLMCVAGLLVSGGMKVVKPKGFEEQTAKLGWSEGDFDLLAVIEISCALIYLLPRTSVLGAILVTGYLGGAVATHVRIGDGQFVPPIVLGILIWSGVGLRSRAVRYILPLRRDLGTPGVLFALTFVIVLALIGLGVFVALQPDEFSIARSATIPAPPAVVFDHVNDFHKWDAWSPWKKLDPSATNTFEGPEKGKGAILKWSGNDKIGEGMMKVLDSLPPEDIKIHLEFFRPFPSVAQTDFTFKPAADGKETLVTWTMTGKSNLMFKAMHLIMDMDQMLGSSFDEGLTNLKTAVAADKR